jgi:two-component system chemotaxis response regulator CheY
MGESISNPREDFEISRAASRTAREMLGKLAVLVVDDQAIMAHLVARMLTDIGVVTLHLASTAPDALGMIREGLAPLDLIICDLNMPDRDGFAFVSILRNLPDPHVSQLPILILTGNATAANIEIAVKLGIHGVIAKPVTAAILQNHLLRVIESPAMLEGKNLSFGNPKSNLDRASN